MIFACMTAEEYAAWREAADVYVRHAGQGPTIPCWDCPAAFRAAALKAGTCQKVLPKELPPRDGMTSEERHDRQRRIKRDWMRASRARAKGYTTVVGVSDKLDSATMRDDAASGAYSTGGRVAAFSPGVRR